MLRDAEGPTPGLIPRPRADGHQGNCVSGRKMGQQTPLRSPAAAGWQPGACRARKPILVESHQPPAQPSLGAARVCGDGEELRRVRPRALCPARGRGEPVALVPAQPSEVGQDPCRKTGRLCPPGMAAAGGLADGGTWGPCWSSGSDLRHTWQRALPPRPCLAQLCCVLKFESDAIFDCCFTSVGRQGWCLAWAAMACALQLSSKLPSTRA